MTIDQPDSSLGMETAELQNAGIEGLTRKTIGLSPNDGEPLKSAL